MYQSFSVSIYGYFAAPTFDPHLYYGKTLLELARLEDSVFSNALQGIATTDEEACRKQNNGKDGNIEEVETLTGHFSFLIFGIEFSISDFLSVRYFLQKPDSLFRRRKS